MKLFEPFESRSIVARNRIVASPMCQYQAVDGNLTDWHVAHLGRLAIGGTGIVFVEETAVEARGRKTYSCAGLWSDEQIPTYRRVADVIRGAGAVPALQLGHSGRRGSTHDAQHDWAPLQPADAADGRPPWRAVAPSPIAVDDAWPMPHPLTVDEIGALVTAWADAARRADDAGFDVLEIHGAHGYLIHQFLSPITNARTDGYGGDRSNRMRFAVEVAEAARASWPADKPLFFRASCVDGRGGVWDLDDTVELARALAARGVDLVDCSSGGINGDTDMPVVRRVPGYQVEFARSVRARASVPTLAVGMITEPRQAEDVLASGGADVVGIARELLVDGDWPVRAARELGVPDPYGLLPGEYAFRLRRRDHVARMPINQAPQHATADEDIHVLEST